MFCSERWVDHKGNSAVCQRLYTPGSVEGTPVECIVLDKGYSRTVVRSNLVSQDKVIDRPRPIMPV